MMPSFNMFHQCSPNVAPATMAAIIQVESGGNPYALGINGWHGKRPHPRNASEANIIARYFIGQGYSVDMGLMQINSANLKGLELTTEQILDPCTNLRAGSQILSRGYRGATKRFGEGQDALKAALSAYNTGNYEKGFRNGYVAKYYRITLRVPRQATSSGKSSLATIQQPDIYSANSTVFSIEEENTHE
jgi:type IV secretion system protein VirB1